ncbi:hypothetical protein CH373_12515 [Leptospira perolatii]|uniref:Fatty acid hydroxylase domain-containing protein n=1 Tax=Leptospira perolatii TaxID=2023191 RepID=A0A2M9ZLH9_9LEPT|nr:sterol desaturase family protein [Leptospira perolatii]PJZ70241.1 hypothetical protein CH360_06455 [Leptospira perolatii]PJZ72875.1 hypothetical protein CH373_12515 [Leptospira perolatii]
MWDFLQQCVDIGIYFSLLGIGLAPLEQRFAAHNQPFFRKEWVTDFFFFLGGNLLWTKATLVVLSFIHEFVYYNIPKYISEFARSFPLVVQIFVVIFLSDLFIYWAHRLSHKYDILWRFHKIHHTAEHLDWLAAFREHPLDNIYTRVIVNIPALVLGFPLEAIGSFVIFRGVWGNFIHSNTDFGLGPLKYILGTPRLHHWHHDLDKNSSCNFANLMPMMDVLFGTFYDPGKMPEKYGIDDPIPRNYFSQIFFPLLPNSLQQSLRESNAASFLHGLLRTRSDPQSAETSNANS